MALPRKLERAVQNIKDLLGDDQGRYVHDGVFISFKTARRQLEKCRDLLDDGSPLKQNHWVESRLGELNFIISTLQKRGFIREDGSKEVPFRVGHAVIGPWANTVEVLVRDLILLNAGKKGVLPRSQDPANPLNYLHLPRYDGRNKLEEHEIHRLRKCMDRFQSVLDYLMLLEYQLDDL
ncbi:hypothetical protein BO71DRAFT_433133 [Aspergillus ellipticus CBS 707.79]|uniref:Uncharacterized protein n=1 Tax=Aspergillus ellipticus CBS 707.79 TaxID=1448320 RepID=A0A319D0N5_9EURO|nr:hypothetical protein BO71DRAFT_433133 [Aspergillus ellipticus CBS 707.79]